MSFSNLHWRKRGKPHDQLEVAQWVLTPRRSTAVQPCWFWLLVKELFMKPQAQENRKQEEEKRMRAVNNKLNGLALRHLIGGSDLITEYHLIIIIIGDWSMGVSLIINACLIYYHLLWVCKVCKTPAEALKRISLCSNFSNKVWNFNEWNYNVLLNAEALSVGWWSLYTPHIRTHTNGKHIQIVDIQPLLCNALADDMLCLTLRVEPVRGARLRVTLLNVTWFERGKHP